jgi:hypothetical protein
MSRFGQEGAVVAEVGRGGGGRGQVSERRNVRPYRRNRARIYHDRADCPVGQKIRSQDLVAGTGGRSRCRRCRELEDREPTRSAVPGAVRSEPLRGPYAV